MRKCRVVEVPVVGKNGQKSSYFRGTVGPKIEKLMPSLVPSLVPVACGRAVIDGKGGKENGLTG